MQRQHNPNNPTVRPAADVADRAVGVECGERRWYIAVVGPRAEKAVRDRLLELGYEAYVATQEELHQWKNGRRKRVERVVVTQVVFLHATDAERRVVVTLPFVKSFLTDKAQRANAFGVHPVAVIPDQQMQKLQFVLYQNENPVSFLPRTLHAGDCIRVLRGQLRGFEGEVVRYRDGDTYLVVNIGILGCAMVRISLADVEPVK